jgi:sigma-E factor negative regulatory protein RseA
VKYDEVESQLSAMYDGELPAAECELLSRRLERDEALRARWSRYALIGAAMRSEPVATARSGFAARVSAALARPPRSRRRSLIWSGALAATLVATVAGLSIVMLRDAAVSGAGGAVAQLSPAKASSEVSGLAILASTPKAILTPAASAMPSEAHASYVTPAVRGGSNTLLRTELADYIVAHSAYSTPLMRRNLLSELVTGEEGLSAVSVYPAVIPAQGAVVGGVDASRAATDLRQ